MNDVELFKTYFEYRDGSLYWKITCGTRAIAGNRAGKLREDGYYVVGLKGRYYLVHRIVFAMHNNYLPEIIDHVNRDRSDNRIENLREATYSKNIWNSAKARNNTSGVKGVRLTKTGKYEARVAVNGKTIQVGTFDTLEAASAALQKVRQHEHESFACNG